MMWGHPHFRKPRNRENLECPWLTFSTTAGTQEQVSDLLQSSRPQQWQDESMGSQLWETLAAINLPLGMAYYWVYQINNGGVNQQTFGLKQQRCGLLSSKEHGHHGLSGSQMNIYWPNWAFNEFGGDLPLHIFFPWPGCKQRRYVWGDMFFLCFDVRSAYAHTMVIYALFLMYIYFFILFWILEI